MILKDTVKKLETVYGCNCDLDNWEPEKNTGHSMVCRIHKQAIAMQQSGWSDSTVDDWVLKNKQDKLIRN